MSSFREMLDEIRREYATWPDWRKAEIEAEVRKTPLRGSLAVNPRRHDSGEVHPDGTDGAH